MKSSSGAAAPDPGKRFGARPLAGVALKALWAALVITTPILGAWVASSLAAHANGPVTLAAASGLLAFPVLPLVWESLASSRRKLRGATKPHILTFTDRLILRTLAINLLFLGILIGGRPQPTFAALSTRGDWMLDGATGATAELARKRLFWTADRLEWLYLAVHENPFDQKNVTPGPTGTGGTASPSATPAPKPASDSPSPDRPASDRHVASLTWPQPAVLHPIVAGMPPDAEQSIATVARYIAERESDPVGRFRAAHDWVADRISYDGPSYVAHKYPPQDAESVFRTRTSVCAGYAQLLTALGQALGLDVVYVVGDARTSGTDEGGAGHAWSAVRLGDKYYLADATWSSGSLDGSTFTKRFSTDYLFTPPEVFGTDHFPRDAKWQLRDRPLSRGDFFRQPMMTPRFYAEGLELLSPLRSQVTVSGPLTAEITNKNGLFTMATWRLQGATERQECDVTDGPTTRVTCALPNKGQYLVQLFGSPQQYGSPYRYLGQIEANRQ